MKTKENKFRVWRKDTKEFLSFRITPYNSICNSFNQENLVFLEFSGEYDKNKAEIYEGYIIRLDDDWAQAIGAGRKICLVGFERGSFMFGRSDVDPFAMNSYLWLSADKCEVIGNYFQNPELLEQGIIEQQGNIRRIQTNGKTIQINPNAKRTLAQ